MLTISALTSDNRITFDEAFPLKAFNPHPHGIAREMYPRRKLSVRDTGVSLQLYQYLFVCSIEKILHRTQPVAQRRMSVVTDRYAIMAASGRPDFCFWHANRFEVAAMTKAGNASISSPLRSRTSL